ncbi:MAG: carboxypeptidase regulatory-like domain-containing protein [Terriglobales bacterium]|jgi:outer membrane receptor protein involved in Fe transport
MNTVRIGIVTLIALLLVGLGPQRIFAQTANTGSVTGTVTDNSGAVVSRANISLTSTGKGFTKNDTTNPSGVYSFNFLAPDTYSVSVSAAGFKTTNEQVVVQAGQVATADIRLAVAAKQEVVTVTGTEPLLQLGSGNIMTTLTEMQVNEIPVPGNDLSYFGELSPGAMINTQSGYGNFEVFGLPANANNFTTNGGDDNFEMGNLNTAGASNLFLGKNGTQEVTVVTNAYTGQYGGLSGAQINMVSKSGNNHFHGNTIYNWSGSSLNANDWFNDNAGVPKPFTNANAWAGSVGGPIKRNKLFFFVDEEGIAVKLPTNALTVVPSQEFEQATVLNLVSRGLTNSVPFYCQNLAGICPGVAPVGGVNQGVGMFNLYNTAPGIAKATPGNGSDPIGCSGLLSPDVDPLLGTPGHPCALSIRSAIGTFVWENKAIGRLDYVVGSKDLTFLQISYDTGTQPTFTDTINNVFNSSSYQPEYSGQFNWNHTFSANATSQFILAAKWLEAKFDATNLAQKQAAFPTQLNVNGFTTLGGTTGSEPNGQDATSYGVTEDVAKVSGNHTIKFGGKFHRTDMTEFFGFNTRGTVFVNTLTSFFNGGSTGDSLIQSYPKSIDLPFSLYNLGVYIEDAWRAKPHLTLTAALRVEHYSNPVCQNDCFATLNGPFYGVSHDPNQPLNQAINANQHQAFHGMTPVVWSPRFSFSWQPYSRLKDLVLRGGVGIFYSGYPTWTVNNFASNVPEINTFVPFNDNLAPGENTNLFADAAASNQAFVNGFSSGLTLAQIRASVPPALQPFFTPSNFNTSDARTKIPQYQEWNLEVQYGVNRNTMISINYVGNHGVDELINNASANAFGFGTLPASAPDSLFHDVSVYTNAGISNYNGLVMSFRHQISSGWGRGVLEAHYTWSHSFDDVSGDGMNAFNLTTASSLLVPENPYNIRSNYGPSDYDARHSFNMNYVWDLPIRQALSGHGPRDLVDGWMVSGGLFARSGFPFSVIDAAFGGSLSGNNFTSPIFPEFLGSSVPSCGPSAAQPNSPPCLSTSQFTPEGTEANFVNGMRNRFRGPGFFDTDFAVNKSVSLHLSGPMEKAEFRLGVQFFNVFNHPNFDLPVNDISNSEFGRITRTVSVPTSMFGVFFGGDASPRLIQLKAELRF